MSLWYLSHRRPAKAQASLRIRAVSPEPSLFAHMKYGSRRKVRPEIRHLVPWDGWVCAFEDWVYGEQKVPQSHELAQLNILHDKAMIRNRYNWISPPAQDTKRERKTNPKDSITRKSVFGVYDQVRLKPGCSAIETSYSLEISAIASRDIILSRQRTTKALMRLRWCAGWSAPLLFAYCKKEVFSWRGSSIKQH